MLEQMVANGALEQASMKVLIKSTIKLDLSIPVDLYPDYVTYVHQELKNLVASSEGLDKSLQSTDVLYVRTRKPGWIKGQKAFEFRCNHPYRTRY
ncbi:hypothetical protein KEH51_11980 [[Brevibacterium] frigoritolerans]|uniref:Uncharacterized protein n=1 Tax=Peribacillus frigoritolerans TaxID=450367 RepID=A0A941J6R1_9BACI|nr:hypothetical protein [Peribacillus frigoritolerans]